MFSPDQALAIISANPHLSPVLSTKGGRKGQHIKYAYRFEGTGTYQRHISISRKPVNHGITVYVNELSTSGVKLPENLAGIEVLKFYPQGSVGETGDKGLSSAAGGLPTLLPKTNNVYRLAVGSETAFKALLDWYYGMNPLKASELTGKAASSPNAASTTIGRAAAKVDKLNTALDLHALTNSFIDAFTGQRIEGRLGQGGMGIGTGRHWFASIYIERLAKDNLIEVVFKPEALSDLLNGCPVHLIERWIVFHQQTTGNESKGHRSSDPWPCIGFTSIDSFYRMLADWKELKKSWKLFQKPHAELTSFIGKSSAAAPIDQAPPTEEESTVHNNGGQLPAMPNHSKESGTEPEANASQEEVLVDEVTLRAIKTRRGQASFRSNLLSAYKRRCAFTGCPIENVLEAAHITSHSDGGGYATKNGLLLRADIHTLFDLYLIGADSENKIRVSKRLNNSDYCHLEGKPLLLPDNPVDYPCQEGLATHLAKLRTIEEME